jgi:cytoskeleton-associated protein 5
MEKNTAAGRTPSSLPISTPPPSALNVSSPDLQPLSPVHTNSLNDAKPLHVKPETTNFHLPPSYAEDNSAVSAFLSRGLVSENSLGDQRNEKLIGGGKFTNSLSLSLSHTHTHTNFIFLVVFIDGTHCVDVAVTSGTLDAIRERMKSMQLAAATGNPDSGSRPLMSMNENLNNGLSSQILRAPDSTGMENPLHSGVLPMDEKALSGLQARMERLKSGSLEPL